MWPARFIVSCSLAIALSLLLSRAEIRSEDLASQQDPTPTTNGDTKSPGTVAACQSEAELHKLAFEPNATESLRVCLEAYPYDPLVHFFLGAAHHRKKDFQSATFHLKESLAANPQFGRAWVALGYVYLDQAAATDDGTAYLVEEEAEKAFLEALAIEHDLDTRASAALGLSSLYKRRAIRFGKQGNELAKTPAEQAAKERYNEALGYNPTLGSALTQSEIANAWPAFVFLPKEVRASQVHDSFRALRQRVERLRELDNVDP